ncbi:GTPase HflX [Gluconacetobacter liquefaciens]|uniref:GTPase HflX n=1 Tax=Gluconacetobacter liquefaciens TaxID=89584 RepID=A0A370FXB4_GLULI|nr:GTPase HflX [Gluconacetobacter liquefaciens]MBB2188123.1 GTPase HflX [Gluconacetobacter liquefaciens]RDI36095.1 GTP-binding protein HflX [Gluconacetobacter liquefaciens]GEB38505.1 GTPase HflX [Gluconacetobacter liquefaciens]
METTPPVPRAVLVGIQTPDIDDVAHEASLEELGRLVKTLGYEVVGSVSQKREGTGAASLLGAGKLEELAALTGGSGVVTSMATPPMTKARKRFETTPDTPRPSSPEPDPDAPPRPEFVIVDHELSPSQIRNLERATGAQVLDRTGVIVEIFHRHANTREAKLQVEMARLKYVAPRLRESGTGGGRQQGPGAGESHLDLDRRKIRDRLAELKTQLEAVQRDSDQRRSARRDQLRVALVGYTNAGKSSLMRALTGSQVLVQDKLFATLDTTVRTLQPETRPRVLVSDTVGFIKQLPHDLVASFRSTLSEALEASLLLFVVDASDPTYEAQLEVSRSVLREIGADTVPSRLVLNKMDRVDATRRAALLEKHPDAIMLSAHAPEDVSALRETIIAFFEAEMVDDVLVLPYAKQKLIGEIYESARVLSEDHDETGRVLKVRALPGAMARLRRSLAAG